MTSCEGTDESDDFTSSPKINQNESRRTYLLTYSRADLKKFPDCKSFSNCVLEGFSKGKSTAKVTQWATCLENHKDAQHKHYHMAIKLSGTRRWYGVFKYLKDNHDIIVNFSSKHCGYIAAYRYVCKGKPIEEVLHSPGHANLEDIGSPRTKNAMKRFSENAEKRRSTNNTPSNSATPAKKLKEPMKPKKLTNIDVSEYLVKHNVQTENELHVIAKQRHDDGEKDMYSYIINKSQKALSEIVSTTWKIQNAPAVVVRKSKSRLDILRDYTNTECAEGCDGQWYCCAKEVLKNNGINLFAYSDAIRQCLKLGRQKFNNIMLVGPTNCGKSFLLDPLEKIYKAFMNPSATSYAWIGLDACEVAYLNDFRYSQECIKWSDFLLLLEGQTVNLPRPKNQFSTDLTIPRENTIPFFATSKRPIEYIGKYFMKDDIETAMMASRWKVFSFSYEMPAEKIRKMPICAHCFAKLVMQGSEMD